MKGALLIFLAILLPGVSISLAAEQPVAKTEKEISQLAEKNLQDARQSKAIMERERAEYLQGLEQLKKRLAAREKELSALQNELHALSDRKQALEDKLNEQSQDLKTVEGSVRIAARQAKELMGNSLFIALYPDWLKTMDSLLDSGVYPGIDSIDRLTSLFFDFIEEGNRITLHSNSYIDSSGRVTTGKILLIGPFTAIYQDQSGDVGYLQLDNQMLTAAGAKPDWFTCSKIKDYLQAESDSVVMDLSNGAVFARMLATRDWKEWINSGGFLLWPILTAAVLGILILIERIIVFFRIRQTSDELLTSFFQYAEAGKWARCESILQKAGDDPVINVLKKLMAQKEQGQEVMEATLQEAVLHEMPRLEKFLSTLRVLAAISPLLGLLGTVTGMINTFQVITVFGTGDPRLMSGGISEALITTQAGLAVAIPLMLAAHFLKRRISAIMDMMDGHGTGLIAVLLRSPETEHADARAHD